jgi:hypothetical protein
MQISMLQHDQYMDAEHQRRGKECKDCIALQQMLANAAGGASAALNGYTNNQEE